MRLAIVLADADRTTVTTVTGEGSVPELVIPTARLSVSLAAGGHDVTVYIPGIGDNDDVIEAQGYRVVSLPAGPADSESGLGEFTAQLTRAWQRDRPDVAHAPSWLSGMVAQSAARPQQIPVVQTFDSLAVAPSGARSMSDKAVAERARLEPLLARRAQWVAANNTEEMFELLRKGCVRSRISVVPCGVDLEVFTPPGPVAERMVAPARIVSIASATGRYDVVMAVRVLAALADAELVFAVDAAAGPAVAAEAKALQKAARDAGVGDRVRVVQVSSPGEVAQLLRSADISACVAATEPSGAAALMAMGCGVPVVATAVGALADVVVDDVTGRLVPAGDIAAFVDAARRLLHEPFAARGMGAAGRDRARSRYSWDRVAADAARAYAGALGTMGVVSA